MYNWTRKILLIMSTYFIFFSVAFGQGGFHHGGGHFNPDSLTLVTVSGTTMVDTTMFQTMYYLDEDGNGIEDYILNFGPPWYNPDSSNATRPQDGDPVTITGGKQDSTMMNISVIVVYEINGEFWRDPYDPLWTNMGYHNHGGGHHQGGMTGFAFGWMHDTLTIDTINGSALVDTTFVMEHYYLDEDGDNNPDYFLNFGPPWYQPASGAVRPNPGDNIEIIGGVLNHQTLPMVIVFKLNGLVWRDSTGFGHYFGGGWITRNMIASQRIHAPFDSSDWMNINPGWYSGGGHHGMMMPDTLFCQMLELYPQNMPNPGSLNIFAGYEIGMFFPNGMNGMWQNGGGGHMNFSNNVQFQFHYNDIQIQGFNIDESTITAHYWDSHANNWVQISGATIDPINNRVTFQESVIGNFILLAGQENVTLIEDREKLLIDGFILKQNYPNPFNPVTQIDFILDQPARVELTVYNVLGQQVQKILDREMNAGLQSISFDGQQLPSGIYFYQLMAGNVSQVRKMELLK
ncbi:MAG: T9SS type A sorting domain-containing protein [bacterium]|nr:MAG: T9SS type A sorting domain-containing protein [bacterium]